MNELAIGLTELWPFLKYHQEFGAWCKIQLEVISLMMRKTLLQETLRGKGETSRAELCQAQASKPIKYVNSELCKSGVRQCSRLIGK